VQLAETKEGMEASSSINSIFTTLRTTSKNTNPQFGFMSSPLVPATNFSVDFIVAPVVCQIPANLTFCAGINWPTADYANAVLTDELANFAYFLLGGLFISDPCSTYLKQLVCAGSFPRCDDAGFDIPICEQDCEILKTSCAASIPSLVSANCTATSDQPSYCYFNTTLSSTSTSGVVSGQVAATGTGVSAGSGTGSASTTQSGANVIERSFLLFLLVIFFCFTNHCLIV